MKSLIPRMRVWSGQDLGRGVRRKDCGKMERKVTFAALAVLGEIGGRRVTLHTETLHFWGSQMEYVGLQHWQTRAYGL